MGQAIIITERPTGCCVLVMRASERAPYNYPLVTLYMRTTPAPCDTGGHEIKILTFYDVSRINYIRAALTAAAFSQTSLSTLCLALRRDGPNKIRSRDCNSVFCSTPVRVGVRQISFYGRPRIRLRPPVKPFLLLMLLYQCN
jgi:hypothetical protein